MRVSEAFLVNTKNFDSIINALVEHTDDQITINSNLLEELGYTDPNDLLLVRLLKDLDIIDNEGKPGKFYEEFRDPRTTRKALAKGLCSANEKLFDQYPKIHQSSPEKIQDVLKEVFQGEKTDLIIKYIANTIHKVINYAGVSTIDKVLKGEPVPAAEIATLNTNGAPSEEDSLQMNQTEDTEDNDLLDAWHNDDIEEEEEENVHTEKAEANRDNDTEEDTDEDDFDTVEYGETKEDPLPIEKNTGNTSENEGTPIPSGPTESNATDEIDTDPFDLETPLAEATQKNDTMKDTITTDEHNFVHKALLRKSDLLHKMQRWEELLPTLEEIINRYDNEQQPPKLREAASRSIIRRATTLLKLNRDDEALSALETVIERFKDSENQSFYDQASRAMLYKAQVLEQNDSDELLPLYNTIISRVDDNSEIVMKEKLDHIHLKRFDLILKEGDDSQILDASTSIIRRFKQSGKHRNYLQKAMMVRAELLDKLNRDEEALEAYDDFLKTFGS